MDALDAAIVETLTTSPRIGLVEVARRVGAARGTVVARLSKLVDSGAITGFGPEIDPAEIGFPVLAMVFLEIAQGRLEATVEALDRIPYVLEAFGVTGQRDLLCRVVARDNGHLQEVINAMVTHPDVLRSTSYVAMSRQIALRTLPLVRAAADVSPPADRG